jgi:hypothetical protein
MTNPGAVVAFLLSVCVIFVPALIIALAMLRSGRRAFVLAATFSIAAVMGYFVCVHLGALFIEHHASDVRSTFEIFMFGAAGGAGCGVLAVWLLGKLTGHPPRRRDA